MAAARPKLVAVPGARCVHGHDLAACGVYVHRSGWTACRQCARERQARYRKRARRDPIADPYAPDADAVARKAALVHAMLAPEREYRCVDRVPMLVRVGARARLAAFARCGRDPFATRSVVSGARLRAAAYESA